MIVVESPDGLATLTIPSDSLPPGLDSGVISIAPLGATADGITILAGYQLMPSGTEFSSPIVMRVEVLGAPGSASILHIAGDSGESFESAQNVDVEATMSGTSYSFELSHFSEILISDFGLLHAQFEATEAAFVGGLVTGSFEVEVVRSSGVSRVEGLPHGQWGTTVRWENAESAWRARAYGVHCAFGATCEILDPPDVSTGPTQRSGVLGWVSPPPFTCTEPGGRLVDWRLSVGVPDIEHDYLRPNGSVRSTVVMGHVFLFPLLQRDATCLAPITDGTGSFLDSISSMPAGYRSAVFDLESHGVAIQPISQGRADDLRDSVFECGDDGSVSGLRVVCPSSPTPLDTGSLLVATMNLVDPVPNASPDRSFIYSLVLDSDGQSANDWVPMAPFDWDLFQGADRWYQLIWSHQQQSWSLTVTQVDSDQSTESAQSGAWAVIKDNHINFYVPGAEYTAGQVKYRMTAFGHDGNFTAGDRGADVTGTDPTEPLIPVP